MSKHQIPENEVAAYLLSARRKNGEPRYTFEQVEAVVRDLRAGRDRHNKWIEKIVARQKEG